MLGCERPAGAGFDAGPGGAAIDWRHALGGLGVAGLFAASAWGELLLAAWLVGRLF